MSLARILVIDGVVLDDCCGVYNCFECCTLGGDTGRRGTLGRGAGIMSGTLGGCAGVGAVDGVTVGGIGVGDGLVG